MTTSPTSLPVPPAIAANDETAEERANRMLLKTVRMAHTLNDKERELALVLMQAIVAWDGLNEAA